MNELQDTITAIVINRGRGNGGYVQILDIRNIIDGFADITATRHDIDAALVDLHLNGPIRLDIEESFRFLAMNPEYNEAGVSIGGEIRHLASLR